MARNDGIHRTFVRNRNLKETDIANAQRHNERENESYNNPDVILERTKYNVHFKTPTGSYVEMFKQMEQEKTISTRGLKPDAVHYGELIFDVNSAYFHNHGGYEYAKKFYEEAYKAAVKIVGGEQYILSAVMHADERNRAMSEALGHDVYHYHLHVVYVPVVEKQVLWSKRCKDKSLVGTVKETLMQVSSSKKWSSKEVLDENGKPMRTSTGKKILKKSYSVLQDDFFNAMKKAGYTDIERGERGSTEEHLTVTQFKVEREKERLSQLEKQIEDKQNELENIEEKTQIYTNISHTFNEIDSMGRKNIFGKIEFTKQEAEGLKELAKSCISAKVQINELKNNLQRALESARIWRNRYEDLREQTREFLVVMKKAPEKIKVFIKHLLEEKQPQQKQEPVKKRQPVRKKSKSWDMER